VTLTGDTFTAIVGEVVDAMKVLGRVTGLTTAAREAGELFETAAFASVFESALGSFAFRFSDRGVEPAALTARRSCVDIEFNSWVSANAEVDTKDLVAAEALISCELRVAGVSPLRAEID
jgi:hypothetical protein